MVLQFSVPTKGQEDAIVTSSLTGLSKFQSAIAQEFIQGSSIDSVLFKAATEITTDTAPLPGGDVGYPIHEALNWSRITRFGRQSRENLYAVLLLNEDGSTWQAKLSNPRQSKDSKLQKYETPVGNGSRAYLPSVPPEIRQRIAERYGIDVPLTGSFWNWLALHPEIPIVVTEGGKKALALLSLGYVAVALYGVNGGYRKCEDGTRRLIDDLSQFTAANRQIKLAFDQDIKTSTRRRVAVALSRFGMLLEQSTCQVSLVLWRPEQGKGVDDLIVANGSDAWDAAYAQAQPLLHWQISGRLLNQLNDSPTLRIHTAQLSQIDLSLVPDSGIIAISSAKGTEKTKLIAEIVADSPAVLAIGHRIALMRNLSARLGLDYKGDLDRVNGEFVTVSGYTSRIGLCVDSLLAIDPDKFVGCDLVIDETVQVIRHVLTSSTCAKEGMRPVILSRLREIIQSARRVILADADLDSATIRCLAQLRNGDDLDHDITAKSDPVFLIRNDYQPTGYPVLYFQAPDRTAILADLLNDAASLPVGQMLYISTDSKATCKTLVRMLAQQSPDKRVLMINSETSGGDCEREFICNPDAVLKRNEYDIIICSPSVATGVSIEVQGLIAKVYGIFMGASATDADMAQALGRVREPVERVVWCAVRGSNYSKVSRSSNPLELRQHLFERTTVTASLIRSNLRADLVTAIERYDWQSDPYITLYCGIAAAQNYAMYRLRDALMVRLAVEGNQVAVEIRESNGAIREQAAAARADQRAFDAAAIVAAPALSSIEVSQLEAKEGLTPEQSRALSRFYLQEFYALPSLSEADVLWDNEGRRRGEILNLEALLYPHIAVDRTVKGLEQQAIWNQGLCPWDISNAVLRQTLRALIGIDELFAKARDGWEWTAYDLKSYADRARANALHIKTVLHLTIHSKMSDTQIMHQLLSQLGLKLTFRWSRSVEGHEGEKLRVWRLEQAHWQQMKQVIERRTRRRAGSEQPDESLASPPVASPGSPLSFNQFIVTGDPSQKLELPDWEGATEMQQRATELCDCLAQSPERARELLQSWPVEMRVSAIDLLAQSQPEWLEKLIAAIPDLFKWCGE